MVKMVWATRSNTVIYPSWKKIRLLLVTIWGPWIKVNRKEIARVNINILVMSKLSGQECAVLCLVTQLCLTLCDLMDCSCQAPLSMGILQVRILEWLAMLSFRGSSWPRDRIHVSYVSCIVSQVLYNYIPVLVHKLLAQCLRITCSAPW